MQERKDTETPSYRKEQGKPEIPDPRERLADVPLAPHSAGVVGHPPADQSTVDDEREAIRRREEERKDGDNR